MSETNWVVLTGAAGAGKTATVNALSLRGERTVAEASTHVVEEYASRGYERDGIRDEIPFQPEVIRRNIRTEDHIDDDERVFFDRALPDNVAYCELFGVENVVPDWIHEHVRDRYQAVFILEPVVDVTNSSVRSEDEADDIQEAHDTLVETYEQYGYDPILIEAGSIDDRAVDIQTHPKLNE